MIPSCYVAGPYLSAPAVRDVHRRLRGLGYCPTSSWAEHATGPEDLYATPPEIDDVLLRAAAQNDRDIRASDVVLVLDPEDKGRETKCEFARALEWGKAVVYVGVPLLSVRRRGVVVVADLEAALVVLELMKDGYALGRRGALLVAYAIDSVRAA